MELLAHLMSIHQKLDAETTALFTRFLLAALAAPNPNDYVKRKLKEALGDVAPPPPPAPATPEPIVTEGEPLRTSRVKRRL